LHTSTHDRPPHLVPGFTLLEMLLVLVIMAVLASIITINAAPDPRQALAREAQRIGQLMALASDEVRLRQQPIVWEADLRGYRFLIGSGSDQRQLDDDDLLRERRWQEPLTRLSVIDPADGSAQTLLGNDAPPLKVPVAREWVQPRWRLQLATDAASVAVDFDANGHGVVVSE
jgi:general secretion pathway protein H